VKGKKERGAAGHIDPGLSSRRPSATPDHHADEDERRRGNYEMQSTGGSKWDLCTGRGFLLFSGLADNLKAHPSRPVRNLKGKKRGGKGEGAGELGTCLWGRGYL